MSHFWSVLVPGLVLGLPSAALSVWLGYGWYLLILSLLFIMVGVSCGYHRIYAHRAFQPHPIMDAIMLLLGSAAAQGSSINYVALHRIHHAFADTANDTHTPIFGFWHAFAGWQLKPIAMSAADIRSTKHLLRLPLHRFVHDHYRACLVGLIAILALYPPALLVYLGAVGITSVVVNVENHVEHTFGYRNHCTKDLSRNLWWTAPFLGWHNNHHHNPSRFSTRENWWEIDL